MRFNTLLIFVFVTAIAMSAACGGTDTAVNLSNANAAKANANVNTAVPATNSALDPVKRPEAATTNDAPTLTPVVRQYYEALKKKDDAMLKGVMSQEFIKSMQDDMKADGKSGSLAAFMASTDIIPDKPVEVRNEKISGNDAVAEIKGGAYLTWTPFAFINEGGKWKFTGGSPVLN